MKGSLDLTSRVHSVSALGHVLSGVRLRLLRYIHNSEAKSEPSHALPCTLMFNYSPVSVIDRGQARDATNSGGVRNRSWAAGKVQ